MGHIDRSLKVTRLKRLLWRGIWSRDRFIEATRLSKLQEGDAGTDFLRLQGYQGYWTGMQG